jgi:hypothetical protein
MSKKTILGWGLGSVALAAILVPATSAGAVDAPAAFTCPAGTDTVDVPYAWTADNTPLLAGTVCVRTGSTTYSSMNLSAGWSGEVKSDGSKGRTEIRFTNRSSGARLDLRYAPGRTEIK